MATTSTSNSTIVRDAVQAINDRNWDALYESWTPEVVERFPDRTCNGRDELLAYFKDVSAAFPDLHIEIKHLAEDGDTVFIRHEISGTHTGGAFAGISPTGKRVTIPGIDHFTVRDGKIVSNFVVFDQMDFGRQLGLLPPDGSAADKAMKGAFNAMLAAKARFARR